MNNSFTLACPICQTTLKTVSPDEQCCPFDGTTYRRIDGIWRMLRPDRAATLQQFIREYETIRRAEGRGSSDSAYYRTLPFADRTRKFSGDWKIRAASYRALVAQVFASISSVRVLDLGAGNGWLSYQLAKRGHIVAAIDLQTNAFDGLGAHVYYDAPFLPIQAEFDQLPLSENQCDVVIFNSSFHYSTSYETTLTESLRVLKPNGRVAIFDTPVYSDAASGKQMVAERQTQFQLTYGFASDALPSENFLTYRRLIELGKALGIEWQTFKPFRGWRWALRPWLARVRRQREPAEFLLIVGARKTN